MWLDSIAFTQNVKQLQGAAVFFLICFNSRLIHRIIALWVGRDL